MRFEIGVTTVSMDFVEIHVILIRPLLTKGLFDFELTLANFHSICYLLSTVIDYGFDFYMFRC